jgi:hypothetical protein
MSSVIPNSMQSIVLGMTIKSLFEIRIRKRANRYAAAADTTCASNCSRLDCER